MDIIVISLLTVVPWLCNAGSTENLALGANAVQSSNRPESAYAKHAVDGNRESDYTRGSCTHTRIQNNPWWVVDLKSIYSINKVIITNRGDCCGERIAGAQIRIGNSLDNNGNNNKLAATVGSIPLGGTKTFTFDPIQGQYVNIFLPGNRKMLTLCEVEVYSGNIAFGANAVQSSTYNELADAKHAVDGNIESNYMRGSCTHTDVENNPWWRVDLKSIYPINKVIITNRGDCCEERIAGAQIRIGNSLDNNGNKNKLAATVGYIPLGSTKTFTFDPIQGQYVNIFLPGNEKVLTLCEVKVYSDNIAFGANAVQSSTLHVIADAKHAVDGIIETDYWRGSCTHTDAENNPWWRVDLKNIYPINKVIITNRGDCCKERITGAQIRIGNSLDNNGNNNKLAATVLTAPMHTETFEFKPIQGRYVNIFLPGTQKILTLCEVEVYSDSIAFGPNPFQSSTYNKLGDAKHAVDGNRESDYMMCSCSHTEVENNPWWRVDLKSIYSINKVIITNRGDCCEERIIGAQVHIGNSLDNNGNNELAAIVGSIPLGGTQTYTFHHIQGQYVNIVLPGRQKSLSLYEVEVYTD